MTHFPSPLEGEGFLPDARSHDVAKRGDGGKGEG
jgi:hypothetical protein